MATYDSYKDSGVKWLGQIPSHWDTGKMREFFSERKQLSQDGSETLLSVSEYSGITPSVNDSGENVSRSASLIGYKKCKSSDLIINIMLAWKRGLGISDYDGIVSPAYCVFVTHNINPHYANYLLRTDLYTAEFKRNSTGIIESRLRMYPDDFKNIICIHPPKREQEAIVAYLDKVTAEIDRAIEAQHKMIDALNERKQIIITRAVTRGLNHDAPLRDSGIDWLGLIPAHWDFCKLKYFIRIKSGDAISNTQLSDNGKYLVYGGGEPLGRYDQYNIDKGNIVIGRVGARCGCITPIYGKAWATDNALVVSCEGIDYQFLIHCLIAADLNKMASTNAQPLLTGTKVKNTYITVPNLTEQKEIVSHIERATKSIYLSIANCERMISLFQERKQIIINEVVTGKKKVI